MGWLRQISLSWFQILCIRIIQSGPIPKHIAFIMDGNRRYAEKKKMAKLEGHKSGFDKMSETLQWCIHLGVTEATVYAFSIENFKRGEDEVGGLMNLARENFKNLLGEEDNLMANGVKIRAIGNIDMLPEDIRQLIAKVTLMTKNNNRIFLNIAVAYTSRSEITAAITNIVEAVEDKILYPQNITEELLSKCMYTSEIPDPELIIRTSGELRFSDFLLWQISATCIYFTEQLWPELSFWNLISSILYYQRHCATLNKLKEKQLEFSEEHMPGDRSSNEEKFLEKIITDRFKKLELCLPSEQENDMNRNDE